MFGIYGVQGRSFLGRLEEMPDIRPVVRHAPATAAGSVTSGETRPSGEASPAGAQAIAEYEQIRQVDLERGPLVFARQIMRREVISVRTDDTVANAWRTLAAHHIHQAPVLDAAGQLVGLLSERNLLTAFDLDAALIGDTLTHRVADIMTSPVISAAPRTDIRRIAQVMVARSVDGVPIVDEAEQLTGFISRGDILRAVITDPPLSLWR